MPKKNKAILICVECLSRNYQVPRGINSSERLETKKYCRTCNKHTIHKENR